MPVAFSQIPADVLLPLFYAEVTSAAEPISPSLRLCLIGAMNKGAGYGEGTAVENYPYLLSGNIATTLFGRGSMLTRMYDFARSNAPFAEIWGCALPENPTAERQTWEITVTRGGSASFYGTGRIWIEGVAVNFSVPKTSTAAGIALGLKTAINSAPVGVQATAKAGFTNVLTLTCRYAGIVGSQIKIAFLGCRGRADLSDPASWVARNCLSIAYANVGSGEHTPEGCFAVLQDRPFDVFATGYFGGYFSMAAEDFMDHVSGRWAPNRQLYGHMVSAFLSNSLQTAIDAIEPMTDPHTSVLLIKQSVIPPWCWASALAGQMVTHWSAPPELSRPLQTIELRNCCVGSDDDEAWTRQEKQVILAAGASTFTVDDVNTCRIDRVRTLRKKNLFGDPDPSWADAITMFQAMYFVRQMRARIQGAYPRAALSTTPSGINGFTSPVEIRSLVIHEYKRLSALGLVENPDLFSRYLICERNAVDRNRVDILMRPDFINQLRVVAALVETHLELDATDPTLLAA
jgi:phage tail sheath gpL-like